MDPHAEELPQYIHINQNDFFIRRHKKQKEEDIAICECRYDADDPDSACGDSCLNVLTSTECTPGYCPCGILCKNQKFQKCEYAKTKLFKTEGRGWGLLADENIKAGQFVIEYCGEVISWKEAKRRSQAYEIQGLKDAFIICLNASESIDATRKGSLARFINHSCHPNCETRKWNVLGEIRVGIFAKHDIPIGTELAYDYNFEWFGGAKVRCLCGALKCSGFLGAKSRGFQEDTYLWEDDDDRYSVEKIPVYDSAEDEPLSNVNGQTEHSLDLVQMKGLDFKKIKTDAVDEDMMYSQDTEQALSQKNAMISRIRSNTAGRNYGIGPRSMSNKRSKAYNGGRFKNVVQKKIDVKFAAGLLASREAQEEILNNEKWKDDATAALDSLYDEIRPAIEEHERDSQDNVSTTVAEKWIQACCLKLKAEFDLYTSIVKNVACIPQRTPGQPKPTEVDNGNEIKLLTVVQMDMNEYQTWESKASEEVDMLGNMQIHEEDDVSLDGLCVSPTQKSMDYTHVFTTDEVFPTRDDLLNWARAVGRDNGFVIVIVRSDAGALGRKTMLVLGCERSGKYKPYKQELARRSTKKCQCPFRLRGRPGRKGEGWKVNVVCGFHNHEVAETFEGHPNAN